MMRECVGLEDLLASRGSFVVGKLGWRNFKGDVKTRVRTLAEAFMGRGGIATMGRLLPVVASTASTGESGGESASEGVGWCARDKGPDGEADISEE